MDGRASLEKLIADRLAAGRGQPPEGRRLSFNLSENPRGSGGIGGGRRAQEEMERIIADLEQRLERLGWLTHRHISGSADLQMVPAPVAVRQELALKSSLERPQWQEPVMDPPELRDVMSLAGRVLTIGANTATLVSLERWSTRFVLRLAYADLDHRLLRDRLHTQRERWRGWDDAGTQYRRRGGAGSAGHGLFTEDLVFEPGAPDQARTLTLCVDHDGETERLIVGLDAGPAPA